MTAKKKSIIIQTSGKRKTAIARAVLKKGVGKIKINGKSINCYQPLMSREKILECLKLVKYDDVNIDVTLNGGGVSSGAEAARLAISRALVEHNESFKEIYKNYDRNFLVADVRRKETVKPNSHGKARAKTQKSYR